MPDTLAASMHRPVVWTTVIIEELRRIIRRHRWELLFLTIVLFLVDWWSVFQIMGDARAHMNSDHPYSLLLNHHFNWSSLYPGQLYNVVLAAFWGIWVWRDENPDRRTTLWALPVKRPIHQLIRIGIGGNILLFMYLVTFYAGVCMFSTVGRVEGLIAGFLPSAQFLVLFLTYLNIYLLTSAVALLTENAQRWIFLFLPAGFLIVFGLSLLIDSPLFHLICDAFLPPYGILAGLGFEAWDLMGESIEPAIWAPVMWFGILLVAVIFTTSRHQER